MAEYVKPLRYQGHIIIKRDGNINIPIGVPENLDSAKYQRWLDAGNVPDEPDEPEPTE